MDSIKYVIPIVAIVFGTAVPVLLAALVVWYQLRKTERIHDLALRLAERGQPVPPELFAGTHSKQSDLRRGLVLIGLGIGLAICLAQFEAPWSIGLIPLFMGIGYLLVWKLETGKANKE
jgi:Domain of unknown function (DUF6249)